ncbi:hypothetical protein ACFYZ2_39720 [Streptomyces sviceus]|uniref:hypothetical protein n=1 Tax=Streptomyces sviceus TaxID=285530 RepID=UPI0036747F00
MNTERPDNNDPDEISGGGDGSAVEARGVGEASAAEASGEVGTSHAGAGQSRADEEGGAKGTEKSAGTAEGSAGHAEEVADADTDDSPASPAAAGAGAAEPDDSASPDATAAQPADLDQPRPSTDDADAGASPAEPDDSASPGSPADLSKVTTPDAGTDSAPVAGADGPATGASPADHDAPKVPAGIGTGQAAPAPELADSEIPRHGDAGAPRPARHRSPVAIAAVAAAVLLVGGGGAYLAAGASGGSGDDTTSGASGDATPPPLALDGYRAGGGGGNGIAPGEPNPYGVTYRVDGSLPDGPDSAPVYRTQGQVTEDDVARLAEALGVDGTPVAQGQVWRVGVKDGSGPSLQVNRQAPGAWTFQRYSPVIDDCGSATVCGQKPETPTGPPVSTAVAEKAAAPVLKALGQDTAKLDASQVMGAQRIVNADPLVGGLPTYGWATGVTVNGQGEVVGGTGQLKAPVKSDTYPVLSAEKTLGLLNKAPATDHRMGIGGCASPVPLKDRLEAPCGESTASPAKSTLTVEKAVFGLASHFVDGRQALVPSWLFEVRATGAKDAFTVTYPAVDPKYIAAPATATPAPTAPSDEPTSAPKTRDVEVDGYTAEGDELTVSFTGGVCGDYAATASESAGEVKVAVTYTPWPNKICIMIAKEIQKTVPLDEPLGDRKVVGSDGKEIPLKKAGARLPETSGAR